MNLKQYIESGILEQYVLGDLSESSRKEVESMAIKHPEIKTEIEAIELALEKFALSKQITPSAGVYSGIKDRISFNKEPITPASPKSSFAAIIVGGLALIGLALAAYFFWQLKEVQADLQKLETTIGAEQIACDSLDQQNTKLESQLRVLRAKGNQSFFMLGSNLAPQAIVAVHVNTADQRSFLDIINLPTPPTDKQYQLWALIDGQPVDMGVIDINIELDTFNSVPYIEGADMYAVTLEPVGGSEGPTLDQLYVISAG